ncbi:uncharacterized protein [Mytilus edulis]|uniref:uncharacterized protein n=1 Tax=Mytilus edulis TaxID=6550 RepID=UPI0039F09AB1
MSATIILLLSSFVFVTFSIGASTIASECKEVFWAVKLEYGGDVTLICKTDAKHLCSECRKVWYGGPAFSLLSLDGFPSADSFKYLPFLRTNGFEIIIRNFSSEDLNQHYICSIGEHSCKRNLTINMFDKHLLDRDVQEDDTNSNTSKIETIETIATFSGVGVFLILSMIYLIRCKYNLREEQSKSKDSNVSSFIPAQSYDSKIISNDTNNPLFIKPVTDNKDENKHSENDELIRKI